jgi:hypothetical protein
MHTLNLIQSLGKMLHNLDTWLGKATEHAKTKPFDVEVLVHSRLAPDMYSLDRQVQSACDAAKFAAAYLSAKEAPKHPDTEKTLEELRKRIAACLGYLETLKEADFAGADDRRVAPPWLHGKWVRGEDYLLQIAVPNCLFHVTTAYAILRHNGVPLGKQDYIGSISLHDA